MDCPCPTVYIKVNTLQFVSSCISMTIVLTHLWETSVRNVISRLPSSSTHCYGKVMPCKSASVTNWTVVLRQNLTELPECVGLGTRLSQTFNLLADSVDNGTHFFVTALLFVCLCPHGLHKSAVHSMWVAPQ